MWLLVIGLCIGFIAGNIVGVVLMGLMAAASRESIRREIEDDFARINKISQ